MKAGTCDICGCEVGTEGGSQLSAQEMRAVASSGFNPYKHYEHLGLPALVLGVSVEAQYEEWKQGVTEDTTDWRLCGACSDLVGQAQRSGQATSGSDSMMAANNEIRAFFKQYAPAPISLHACSHCGIELPERNLNVSTTFTKASGANPRHTESILGLLKMALGEQFPERPQSKDPFQFVRFFSNLTIAHCSKCGANLCPHCRQGSTAEAGCVTCRG